MYLEGLLVAHGRLFYFSIFAIMKLRLSPEKAKAELCRRSFYYFVQTFWSVIIPEEPVWSKHIKYLCDELQAINERVKNRQPKLYDLIINVPPGSSKSTIASQMYNAWVWIDDPSQRLISSSHTQSLAISHSMKTRDLITSDLYRRLFPELELKADQSGKSDFRNNAGGQRFTTSTGAKSATGVHGHQKILDDLIDPTSAESEAEREAAEAHLKMISSRNTDRKVSVTILIMQRLNQKDPTGIMLDKKKKVKHICLPATISDNVSPPEARELYSDDGYLDPIRLGFEELEDAKVDLGSYGYAGQMMQRPAPEEGGLLKRKWFEIIEMEAEFNHLVWHFVADTAYTKDEKNDPSGYIAYAQYRNNFIIRAAETAHLEFPELCKALPTFAHANGYSRRSRFEVEPKASGKSLVQTLSRETSLNIMEGDVPTKDKTARVKDASPTIEAGRVKLIRGGWNKAFLDQVCTFPNADHDEYVDNLTMMVGDTRPVRQSGVRVRN